jgi:DNA mismatch endonuclease, patch repair protein
MINFKAMRNREQISKNMQAVRSKDTKIEILLRKRLWRKGIRYRKNYKDLIGTPDIAITKYKIAIFCDSEFWHGYDWDKKKNEIKTNKDFWYKKIEKNIERDRIVENELSQKGWIVLRFWGKEISQQTDKCLEKIEESIIQRKVGK